MSTSSSQKPTREGKAVIRRGELLLLVSAVAFSTAGFFARQAPVNPWAMTLWRGLSGSTVLALVLLSRVHGSRAAHLRLGRRELSIIGLFAFGTICFVAAFARTSVAHVAVIYATAPMISSALAWSLRGETMPPRTLAAACLALLGVCTTVAGSLEASTLFGDALVLAMTLSLSMAAVLARGAALPVISIALMASMLAASAVVPLGWFAGAGLLVGWRDAAWLAGFGIITMAVAMPCYLTGATLLPAGRTMLISALEMPLAPLWVWLAFGEAPSTATLVGGGTVAVAILADLTTTSRQDDAVVRHPNTSSTGSASPIGLHEVADEREPLPGEPDGPPETGFHRAAQNREDPAARPGPVPVSLDRDVITSEG